MNAKTVQTQENVTLAQVNSTLSNLPKIQPLIVPSSQWKNYVALKAKASALKKQIEAYETSWGVKSGEDYAKQFSLGKDSKLEIPIQDGNANPLGKLSVSYRAGFEMPACFMKRIS